MSESMWHDGHGNPVTLGPEAFRVAPWNEPADVVPPARLDGDVCLRCDGVDTHLNTCPRGHRDPKPGMRFQHARQIHAKSSPKSPGGVIPEECTVTAVRQGQVHYRNSTGFRSRTDLDNFAAETVLEWIEPQKNAGEIDHEAG